MFADRKLYLVLVNNLILLLVTFELNNVVKAID